MYLLYIFNLVSRLERGYNTFDESKGNDYITSISTYSDTNPRFCLKYIDCKNSKNLLDIKTLFYVFENSL